MAKRRYDSDTGYRLTNCCGGTSSLIAGDLVCDDCYERVNPGEGDDTEQHPDYAGYTDEDVPVPTMRSKPKAPAPAPKPVYAQIRDLMPREAANLVANPIVAAAREVADRHGLTLTAEATGRTESKIVFTMTLSVKGQENAPEPPPADFRHAANMIGVDPALYGRRFRGSSNTVYTITGIKPTRYKYPFSARGPNGGQYKFSKDQVLDGLIAPRS